MLRAALASEVRALEARLAEASAVGSQLVASKMEADARIAAQAAALEDMRQELSGIRMDDADAVEGWQRKLQRRDARCGAGTGASGG